MPGQRPGLASAHPEVRRDDRRDVRDRKIGMGAVEIIEIEFPAQIAGRMLTFDAPDGSEGPKRVPYRREEREPLVLDAGERERLHEEIERAELPQGRRDWLILLEHIVVETIIGCASLQRCARGPGGGAD